MGESNHEVHKLVSFSIIINDMVSGVIQPQRGLRQGCPLFPYLFIICPEAFSSLLMQDVQQKQIHGLSFKNGMRISHLLFVDDSLVFIRASTTDYQNLKIIFYCYMAASGQLFNYDKCSMFFSCNVQNGQTSIIKNIF